MMDGCRAPPTGRAFDVHGPAELRHWVREFGRPAIQLIEAVNTVGPLVADVRIHLQKRALYRLR